MLAGRQLIWVSMNTTIPVQPHGCVHRSAEHLVWRTRQRCPAHQWDRDALLPLLPLTLIGAASCVVPWSASCASSDSASLMGSSSTSSAPQFVRRSSHWQLLHLLPRSACHLYCAGTVSFGRCCLLGQGLTQQLVLSRSIRPVADTWPACLHVRVSIAVYTAVAVSARLLPTHAALPAVAQPRTAAALLMACLSCSTSSCIPSSKLCLKMAAYQLLLTAEAHTRASSYPAECG